MDDETRFSVVLPVCHGGALLRRALESLRAMDYPPHAYEVIVAAAPGQPEAERLVDETCSGWPVRVRALHASRAGKSAQLNTACNAARGRVLAFTDDDCTPPPDWLRRIEQELARRPATAVLGGTDELSGADGSFDVALDWVLSSFAGTGGARAAGGGMGRCYPKLWNMAVRREAAMRAAIRSGGDGPQVFDERLCVHEDVDLCVRIERRGGAVAVAPHLRVWHRRETSFGSFLTRNFRMAQVSRRIGAHRGAHCALAGILVGGVLLVAGAVVAPLLAPVALGAVGAYILLLLGCGVAAAVQRRGLRIAALVPLLLAGLHGARAVGYLWPTFEREEEA